jgi:hypothetical protein
MARDTIGLDQFTERHIGSEMTALPVMTTFSGKVLFENVFVEIA